MNSPTSGITANSTDLDQHHLSTLNLSVTECLSSDWTDEKHSMYLKSMEASFVDQLYKSMNSSARLMHARINSSNRAQVSTRTQFKVYQNGSWRNSKLDKGEPSPQQTQESHCLQGNQRAQHCRLAWGNIAQGAPILNSGARMLYSSVAQEFSDQNFEEDNDEEAGGVMRASKRPKSIAKSSSTKYKVNLHNL